MQKNILVYHNNFTDMIYLTQCHPAQHHCYLDSSGEMWYLFCPASEKKNLSLIRTANFEPAKKIQFLTQAFYIGRDMRSQVIKLVSLRQKYFDMSLRSKLTSCTLWLNPYYYNLWWRKVWKWQCLNDNLLLGYVKMLV